MRQTTVWPLAAVLAAAYCVSACGTASAPAAATAIYGAHGSASTPASSAQPTAAGGRGTPGAALANWIHEVAVGNRQAACDDMAAPGRSSAMTACMSSAGAGTFTALHGNFVTDGIKSGTPISVTGAHVTGTSATVSGGDVCVGSKMLDTLMAEHSTGIKQGQLGLSFSLSRVDGAWYVTNMNLNAG